MTTRPAGRTQLFASLCTLVFLVNFARVVFAPLLEPLRAAFHLSAGAAGLLATLAWVGSAVPRLPTGYLLTRVERHRVVAATGGILVVAATFTAFANTYLLVAIGALLMGTASGAYFIAANPLVSELFPEGVGRALGIHGMASQIAAASAPLAVSGVLAVSIWPIAAWRIVFVAMAVVAFVATAALVVVSRRVDLPEAGAADRDIGAAFRAQWRLIVTGVAIIGVAGFVWNAVFNLYVTYALTKGIAESTARTLLTGVFAAGIPSFLVAGRLADRFPNVPLLLTILLGFAAALFAFTLAEGLAVVAVVSLLMGAIVHGLFPTLDTYLLGSLPDHHRASAYALYSASMMVVQASGSVTIGTLHDYGLGYTEMYQTCAVGVLVVTGVMFALYRFDRLPRGHTG